MAKVTELEKNKIKIEFEIAEDVMKDASMKAYQKRKGKFTIPGFRKGKAPKAVIEQYYGAGVFFEDAFDLAFPDAYSTAIEEMKVEAVSRPENVDVVSMNPGEPMVISAEVWTKPEVELGEYKGVSVEYKAEPLTDEDIEAELKKVVEQNARFVDVERAAQDGDKVVIDYSGSVDGEKFQGGTAEGQTLDLGSGMFIPGFEEQVVGMQVGEEKDINVKFPEEYHAKELSGKDAVFSVKLVAVKEKQLPEMDDELAQDISDFDTFAEYKADFAAKLKEDREKRDKNALENAVIKSVVEACSVDIPACMVENQVEYSLRDLEYSLMYQGLNMELYLQYMGLTEEALREQMRSSAEEKVKTQLVLQAIRDAEKIEAEDADMEKEMAEVAKERGKELAEYKDGMKEDEKEYIKDRAVFNKLVAMLIENAKIKAPKKKPASKKTAKKAEKPAEKEAPAAEQTEE